MTDNMANDQRPVPDREKCRTRYVMHTFPFSDCLVENVDGCEYGVRFGGSVFCYHPDRRSFEKTQSP